MLRSNALSRRGGLGAALIITVLAAFALLPSCNDPQAPAPVAPTGPDDYRGSYGTSAGLEFRLDVPGGDSRTLRLVASGLVYDADAQQLHVQVAIRNAGTEAVAGPGRVLLADFDPQDVQPVNAEPLACPACIPCPCWPWAYNYSGKYGDDGMLGPGETSTPIEWILDDPAGQSFSFRARLERDDTPAPGTIAGTVFVDQNGDGQRQEFEPGISGVTMHLAHGDTGTETTTDVEGGFQFQVTEEGLYEVNHVAGTDCPLAPEYRSVVIVRRGDGTLSGYARADFACRRELPPPMVLFHGVVFEDLDRDGQRSPSEPGVANVLVYADAANCPTFAPIQVRTDRNGAYRLPLPGGCPPPYRVGHEGVQGFVDTTPNPLVFDTATPPDSGDVPGVPPPTPDPNHPPGDPGPIGREFRPILADFGIASSSPEPGDAIFGLVFDDLNSNGVADPLEPGLAGIAIGISGLQCGAPPIERRTDEQGRYVVRAAEIPCPPPWRVEREALDGRCDTTPNPVIVPIDAAGTIRVHQVDFGSAACDPPVPTEPILGGTVFDDLDRDGGRDRGEPGVPGVTLRAMSPCDAIWETVTDAQGNYKFTNIGCAVLGAQIVRPEFAHYTTPNPAFIRPNAEPHTLHFGVARGR